MNRKKSTVIAAKGIRTQEALLTETIDRLWREVFSPSGEVHRALSELCALAKSTRVQHYLNAMPERAQLRGFLTDSRPKVRKNAARLLGALYTDNDLKALEEALFAEKTLFVLPSLVLAIGNGREQGAAVLKRFAADHIPSGLAEDIGHEAEISAALSAALSHAQPQKLLPFLGFSSRHDLVLTAPQGCESLLCGEAKEQGIVLQKTPEGCLARDCDCTKALTLRCCSEVLFPLWKGPFDPDLLGQAALAALPLLTECFGMQESYRYRIELRGTKLDRTATIRALTSAISRCTQQLINAPSSYDVEFRFLVNDENTRLYLRFPGADTRFSYRTGAVSASIDPVVAANLMRFVLPHMRTDARVLDPCCGSGTLLAERAAIAGTSELVGVDIDKKAVAIARANLREGNIINSHILCGDALSFRPRAPFDELYANLPFGTRVGTRETNDRLYAGLMRRLDELVSPDGFALFYTIQKDVLLRLSSRTRWKVCSSLRLEAGGLSPWALLFKREN